MTSSSDAGGSISRFVGEGHDVSVCVVTSGDPSVFGESLPLRGVEEEDRALGLLGVSEVIRLGYLSPRLGSEEAFSINDAVRDAIIGFRADEVYIPHFYDAHFEHRIVCEACLVATRPIKGQTVRRVFAYEVPSETGWGVYGQHSSFSPDAYVSLSERDMGRKIEALSMMASQIQEWPYARSLESVKALAAFRGSSVGVGLAEAFVTVRSVI